MSSGTLLLTIMEQCETVGVSELAQSLDASLSQPRDGVDMDDGTNDVNENDDDDDDDDAKKSSDDDGAPSAGPSALPSLRQVQASSHLGHSKHARNEQTVGERMCDLLLPV